MRRVTSQRCDSSRGFLRSRGDAPPSMLTCGVYTSVPPLTRRCARAPRAARFRGSGSSAHAEMRRACGRPRRTPGRFLRSRGDAPMDALLNPHTRRVPPLTRRCALDRVVSVKIFPGSSAHAEMRPPAFARARGSLRFLRSRGDAPPAGIQLFASSAVPPLTRRCAPGMKTNNQEPNGSSAHAEMRPERQRST